MPEEWPSGDDVDRCLGDIRCSHAIAASLGTASAFRLEPDRQSVRDLDRALISRDLAARAGVEPFRVCMRTVPLGASNASTEAYVTFHLNRDMQWPELTIAFV